MKHQITRDWEKGQDPDFETNRAGRWERLTAREREVLCAAEEIEDDNFKALAAKLGISPRTVETHAMHIRKKLAVKSFGGAAIAWAKVKCNRAAFVEEMISRLRKFRWAFALVLFVAVPASAATLSIERRDFYVIVGVTGGEPADVQRSTDLVNWQTIDLVHYYDGAGLQANYASIIDPGQSFFRLKAPATNASFSVITSAARPPMNAVTYSDVPLQPNGMVWSNDCVTATVNYRVPAGTWQLERNHDLRGRRQTSPTCLEGDVWHRIAPVIAGPASNQITLALPASHPGFLRLKKL